MLLLLMLACGVCFTRLWDTLVSVMVCEDPPDGKPTVAGLHPWRNRMFRAHHKTTERILLWSSWLTFKLNRIHHHHQQQQQQQPKQPLNNYESVESPLATILLVECSINLLVLWTALASSWSLSSAAVVSPCVVFTMLSVSRAAVV